MLRSGSCLISFEWDMLQYRNIFSIPVIQIAGSQICHTFYHFAVMCPVHRLVSTVLTSSLQNLRWRRVWSSFLPSRGCQFPGAGFSIIGDLLAVQSSSYHHRKYRFPVVGFGFQLACPSHFTSWGISILLSSTLVPSMASKFRYQVVQIPI